MLEQLYHPTWSLFVTLTHDSKSITYDLDEDGAPVQTLRKKEFLKWVNNAKTEFPFRYYALGEYGDKHGRPHYHLAAFPEHMVDPYTARGVFDDLWNKGRTQVAEITPGRARYLAGYAVKKLSDADDPRLRGNQQPEFRTSSKTPPIGSAIVPVLVNHYRKKRNSALLLKRGDIERTWKTERRTYSLTPWILDKVRAELGVPLTHRGRARANPNYLVNFPSQEAEQCPEKHIAQGKRLAEVNRQKLHRIGNKL